MFPAGDNKHLLTLTFTIAAGATAQTVPVTFGDQPAQRQVTNAQAQGSVPVTQDGAVTITFAPSAASASISGRVMTNSGRGLKGAIVSLTDQQGNVQTTRTSAFGYYRFYDIEVGQMVIISVSSKLYTFEPQAIQVNEDLTDLDFTAQPSP